MRQTLTADQPETTFGFGIFLTEIMVVAVVAVVVVVAAVVVWVWGTAPP